MKARKRFVAILAVILALLILLPILITVFSGMAYAVTQADIDALKEQKEALQAEQDELQITIDGLEAEQASALERKAALDEQNELARQEIELINEQIDIYDQLIANKQIELDEAIAAEEEQVEKYRTRMRAMEEEGTLSYLSILFEATSFSDFLSRIDMIREIMERDSELEANFIAAREHVETVKADYEATQAAQEISKAELLDRKAELELEIEDACELIAAIEADLETYEAEYLANEAAEAALDEEIYAKIAELEAQRLAEEAAKNEQNKDQNQNDGGGEADRAPGTEVPAGMFIWPTTGYNVTSQWGYRIHPIFGVQKFHSGIDIAVNSGEPIYAAASGTVVTAVYSSSYGNYVMISHGNGYYTLYAHMTNYIVTTGQSVTQGQVIGYVGSTGWSTGPHLHYEVRVNGSTIDPMSCY